MNLKYWWTIKVKLRIKEFLKNLFWKKAKCHICGKGVRGLWLRYLDTGNDSISRQHQEG